MIDAELRQLLEAIRVENSTAHELTRQQGASANSDMRGHLDAALESARQENAAASSEIRRHFDVVLESTRQEVRLVAESATTVGERAQRDLSRLEELMTRGFAETQAMIRFSYAELDRRVHDLEHARTTFEGSLAELQGRVERLEESEH